MLCEDLAACLKVIWYVVLTMHKLKLQLGYLKELKFYVLSEIFVWKVLLSNVQFQKISILPPHQGLEFPEGWGVLQKLKEMHEA